MKTRILILYTQPNLEALSKAMANEANHKQDIIAAARNIYWGCEPSFYDWVYVLGRNKEEISEALFDQSWFLGSFDERNRTNVRMVFGKTYKEYKQDQLKSHNTKSIYLLETSRELIHGLNLNKRK